MTSDEPLLRLGVPHGGPARRGADVAAVEDEQEEARATKRLVIGVGGGARFGQRVTSQSL